MHWCAGMAMPTFIKIDVEGFEPEVLAGLSRPVQALSFEFTTIMPDAANAPASHAASRSATGVSTRSWARPDLRPSAAAIGGTDRALARGIAARSQFRRHLCAVALMPAVPARRPLWPVIILLHAAGFALTLVVFYPGVMNLRRPLHLSGHGRGQVRRLAIAADGRGFGPLVDPIAPGTASIFLVIAASYWLGFALLSLAVARRSRALALAAAAARALAAGIRLRRHDLARRSVRMRVVGGGGARLCRRGKPATGAFAGAGDRAGSARVRRAAAAQRDPGRADPCRLSALAGALLLRRAALLYLPTVARSLRRDSSRLLRDLRCHAAAPAGIRSWSSTSAASRISPSRTSFRSFGTPRKRRCSRTAATGQRRGISIGTQEPCRFVMDRLEARENFWLAGIGRRLDARHQAHPLAYLRIAPRSCGRSCRVEPDDVDAGSR